jgi:hypothetical protein
MRQTYFSQVQTFLSFKSSIHNVNLPLRQKKITLFGNRNIASKFA